MLRDEDFKSAIAGKVTCNEDDAVMVLRGIVLKTLNGNTSDYKIQKFAELFADSHDIGADDFKVIKAAAHALVGGPGAPSTPKTISAADLYEMEVVPPTWIIPGLLPAGLTILAGKPKAGKSWLALDLAIAAASGGALFDAMDCEHPCDVLYLALEDTDYRLKDRMKRLLCGDKPPSRLHFSTEWPASDQGGLDHLAEWVKDQQGAGMIIIDTLQKIRPATKKNSGLYESDYAALVPLKKLADEYKIAVVLVHHVRKAKANDPQETISGSYGLTGASDTNIVLQRDTSTSNASLYLVGRDVGEANYSLMFDKDLGRWQLLGECELPATQLQQDIVAAVNDKALKPSQIAELLDTTADSISHILPKLLKKGLLIQPSYGKYISAMFEMEKNL